MADIVIVEGVNELNVEMTPIAPGLANIYGVVTDRKTGAPLEGVKISLDGITTYTNASGEYLIEDLVPGDYAMTLEKKNYESLSDTVEIVEGNNEISVEMDSIPEIGATLYGKVTDSVTGMGISGVFIRVIHMKDAMYADVYTTTTDSLGNYLLEDMVANVNVYIAFGRSLYEKVEIDSFYLAMGNNELNISMVYEGPPPGELPFFVSAHIPSQVASGEEFWAGQIVYLLDKPNWHYPVWLTIGPAYPDGKAPLTMQVADFWSSQLWDQMISEGRDPTGIRFEGDGEYIHYGIKDDESYGEPAKMLFLVFDREQWAWIEVPAEPGIYTVYSHCKIRERVGKGWHDYGWAWKDLVVGTIKVI